MGRSHDLDRLFAHARTVLSKRPLAPFEFSAAVGALSDVGQLDGVWVALVERAYDDIPENKKIFVRGSMATLYCCLGNFQKAAQFLPPYPQTPAELDQAMRVFLALNRYDEAGQAALRIERLVAHLGNARSVELREALEYYHLTLGQWGEAVAVWKHMPSDPLNDEIMPQIRIARLYALQALVEVRKGLNELEQQRAETQDADLYNDYLKKWENELECYAASLAQVVPAEWQALFEPFGPNGPQVSRPMGTWK